MHILAYSGFLFKVSYYYCSTYPDPAADSCQVLSWQRAFYSVESFDLIGWGWSASSDKPLLFSIKFRDSTSELRRSKLLCDYFCQNKIT